MSITPSTQTVHPIRTPSVDRHQLLAKAQTLQFINEQAQRNPQRGSQRGKQSYSTRLLTHYVFGLNSVTVPLRLSINSELPPDPLQPAGEMLL